jgi:hypothetical protein
MPETGANPNPLTTLSMLPVLRQLVKWAIGLK